jgi:flagellar biosynthesis protein
LLYSNIGKSAALPDNRQPCKKNDNRSGDAVAVALAYKPKRESAPKIVASGRGFVAEQILEVARAHELHVREDADLVQLLEAIEVGSEIPLEAFVAVAEIFTYVYRANGTLSDLCTDAEAKIEKGP